MKQISTLTPKTPYNFPLLLDLLMRYVHPVTDRVHDGAYWRALHVDNQLALITVRNAGTIDSPALNVYAQADGIDANSLSNAVNQIFGFEEDLSPFYAFAKSDDALWRVVEPLQGVVWPRTPTLFEGLMITIIEQQISWVAAQKAQRWLVEWVGNAIQHGDMVFYAFPTPEQIAAATVEQLTPTKITFKRMALMIDIAQKVVSGALDLENLRDVPFEQAYTELISIKGIGHWTACWTLTRILGSSHNYVGANDVALQAAVNHYFYGGTGKIPAEKVTETFARYGVFAGIAAHYTLLHWVMDKY